MASVDRDHDGIWVDTDPDGETVTRWQAVKLAFSLLWNACLPLPRRYRGAGTVVITTQHVVAAALDALSAHPAFVDKLNSKARQRR